MFLTNLLKIVEAANKKLKKAELNIFNEIGNKLKKTGKTIIDAIKKPFEDLTNNQDIFPREKALVIKNRVNIDITKSNEKIAKNSFEKLVDAAKEIGDSMGRAILRVFNINIKPPPRNDKQWKLIAKDSLTRYNRWGDRFNENVVSTVEIGSSNKWGFQKVAGAIKKQVGSLLSKVKQVVNTVSVFVSNTASKRLYKENDFEFVQWVAALDDRLCPYCATRHLHVYKLLEATVPAHVNCRCQLLPFKKEWVKNKLINANEVKGEQKKIRTENEKLNYGATPFEQQGIGGKPPDKQFDF